MMLNHGKPSTLCSALMFGLGLDGSMLNPNCVLAKDDKSCTYCWYVIYATLIVQIGGNALAPKSATYYHVQLGLTDKGYAIKGLVVCYVSSMFYGMGL